jgi:hypothetical protein
LQHALILLELARIEGSQRCGDHAVYAQQHMPWTVELRHQPLTTMHRRRGGRQEHLQGQQRTFGLAMAYGQPHAECDVDLLVILPTRNARAAKASSARPSFADKGRESMASGDT